MAKRVIDVDILMAPGWKNSEPGHWQSRWQERLSTARRIEQKDWLRPRREDWVAAIVGAVNAARQPVVLIGHGLGAVACLHALPQTPPGDVIGMFLVAPTGERAIEAEDAIDHAFLPIPRGKLSVPTIVAASQDDPLAPYLTLEEMAFGWGAELVNAGSAGHINMESGYGPWPEGLMKFAGLLSRL